ncbi:MAG: sialidase family protein [Segetibacter sp.]
MRTQCGWLLKSPKGQNVYGAKSVDGGKTWSKNILVYESPDSTVCECCKPSVTMKGNNVYVMFRNWLNGSRDLYVIKSSDGGKSFAQAQKLGKGSWKLNGCPMDGGGLGS